MEHLQEYWLPYLISNTISIVVLLLSWKKPTAARISLGVIFIAASFVNTSMAIVIPTDYLDYRDFAVVEIYRSFIDGWFAQHTQLMVLCIAVGQMMIGIGMFVSGPLLRPAVVGVMIFGVAIAPLGIASAFPCSVLLALSAALLWNAGLRRERAKTSVSTK